MNILHITPHMGDGVGKAISGLAILGNKNGDHKHHILLLDEPRKLNHIERCRANGVEVHPCSELTLALKYADIVVVSYWANEALDMFLRNFPDVQCRLILWYHNSGIAGPKLPADIYESVDLMLVTTPATLKVSEYAAKSKLVYGFGDFTPILSEYKSNYSIDDERFIVGYVGMATYKRLPDDFLDYCEEALSAVPACHFVMAGKTSDALQSNISKRNMERYFYFTGWINNVKKQLLSFDVFGYLMRPDTTATTENSVLESMAAALPTIVSRHPVGKYLICDDAYGLLVETPMQYAQALKRLYNSESERKQMGVSAREYVIKHFKADDNLCRFNEAVIWRQ